MRSEDEIRDKLEEYEDINTTDLNIAQSILEWVLEVKDSPEILPEEDGYTYSNIAKEGARSSGILMVGLTNQELDMNAETLQGSILDTVHEQVEKGRVEFPIDVSVETTVASSDEERPEGAEYGEEM